MKKIFLILMLILLTACTTNNEFIPKNFIDKEEYFSSSIQDYTDYAKYIYKDNNEIKNNTNYDTVKKENIENIKEYFNEFKNIMESEERLNEYDFNTNQINEGDYYKIVTKEGQYIGDTKYDKFDDYSVYFYDIDKNTLYYIHSNI